MTTQTNDSAQTDGKWDHGSRAEFVDYYADQSASDEAIERAERVRALVLRLRRHDESQPPLDVLDVGCNAGTFSMMWSALGHRVLGVDINEELIELARKRAAEAGQNAEFRVGSATDLPVESESMDIVISPELLEHVAEWEQCLDEYVRVLRPGGSLYLTTTNKLCPKQQEFTLLGYSWYPAPLKRHYEKLSVTSRPELANYATYPAVNWFTFYGLRDALASRGLESMDRFDIMNLDGASPLKRAVATATRRLPPLRWLGQVCTPSTIVYATKSAS